MYTTIQVKKTTKARLAKCGNLSQTFDSVLGDILEHIENCKEWKN